LQAKTSWVSTWEREIRRFHFAFSVTKTELLLEIVRNEWVAGDPLPWDIEADGQTLTLRERARHISVSLNAKVVPMEVRAEFIRLGRRVSVNNHGIRFDGNKAWGISDLALVGAALEAEASSEG
jgi:hypothetical protein